MSDDVVQESGGRERYRAGSEASDERDGGDGGHGERGRAGASPQAAGAAALDVLEEASAALAEAVVEVEVMRRSVTWLS
ncbi:MAG: hypothetical protein OXG37_16185 [Actinomycetia bacterium]|nr:hypothetical protein [Actinomycetes bacterium]